MLFKLIILFLFIPLFSFGQSKFFIGTNGDYSILIDKNVKTKTVTDDSQLYVDYYILAEGTKLDFLLSIRNAGIVTDTNFLYNDGFRNSYAEECGCELFASKKQSYRNFDAIVIEVRANLDGKYVRGYTVGVISSEHVFNVNFFTLESKFDSMTLDFERIMNQIMFK